MIIMFEKKVTLRVSRPRRFIVEFTIQKASKSEKSRNYGTEGAQELSVGDLKDSQGLTPEKIMLENAQARADDWNGQLCTKNYWLWRKAGVGERPMDSSTSLGSPNFQRMVGRIQSPNPS
jgi:hypothetical protein